MTKKLLLIAAVAVMLVGATSAYAYYERWDGWFSSGTLTYNSHDYTAVDSGYVSDSSFSRETDTFYLPQDVIVNFIYVVGEIEDTIEFEDTMFTGSKPKGDESGTKEGSGGWSGWARFHGPFHEDVNFFLGGTWEAEFDYTPLEEEEIPIYEGTWMKTSSSITGVSGMGTSSGVRSARW